MLIIQVEGRRWRGGEPLRAVGVTAATRYSQVQERVELLGPKMGLEIS